MKYRVLKRFADLQDDNHIYEVGDEFPRQGVIVKKARYDELASDKNKLGTPLIIAEQGEKLPSEGEAEDKPSEKKKPATRAKKKK